MISRADFVFTIGYEGNVAVVDGTLKKRYGSLSTEQLVEQGLYKQALCSAIYEAQSLGPKAGEAQAGEAQAGEAQAGEAQAARPAGVPAALQLVLDAYNRQAERQVGSLEQLKRLFGVFEIPEGVSRVMVI